MSNGDKRHLKVRVDAVQRDLEALLKLLGGTAADRERFFEIILGITTPAVFRLVEADLENISTTIKATTNSLKTLQTNAKGLAG
jgi:hypothetical protein